MSQPKPTSLTASCRLPLGHYFPIPDRWMEPVEYVQHDTWDTVLRVVMNYAGALDKETREGTLDAMSLVVPEVPAPQFVFLANPFVRLCWVTNAELVSLNIHPHEDKSLVLWKDVRSHRQPGGLNVPLDLSTVGLVRFGESVLVRLPSPAPPGWDMAFDATIRMFRDLRRRQAVCGLFHASRGRADPPMSVTEGVSGGLDVNFLWGTLRLCESGPSSEYHNRYPRSHGVGHYGTNHLANMLEMLTRWGRRKHEDGVETEVKWLAQENTWDRPFWPNLAYPGDPVRPSIRKTLPDGHVKNFNAAADASCVRCEGQGMVHGFELGPNDQPRVVGCECLYRSIRVPADWMRHVPSEMVSYAKARADEHCGPCGGSGLILMPSPHGSNHPPVRQGDHVPALCGCVAAKPMPPEPKGEPLDECFLCDGLGMVAGKREPEECPCVRTGKCAKCESTGFFTAVDGLIECPCGAAYREDGEIK